MNNGLRFQFFPRSQGINSQIKSVISCFEIEIDKIKSPENNLSSNQVLEIIRPHLEKINFTVETGKSKLQKISIPVLFGFDNVIDKSFNADAVSEDGKIVIEVEAGRSTENNQFLKENSLSKLNFKQKNNYFNNNSNCNSNYNNLNFYMTNATNMSIDLNNESVNNMNEYFTTNNYENTIAYLNSNENDLSNKNNNNGKEKNDYSKLNKTRKERNYQEAILLI